MSELKIVITGTPGVGKTTALASVSDIPPVRTEADTSDELAELKDTTTVAFDFGEIMLEGDVCLRIYGTPGQIRFRYMWEILAEGALGFIILVDATRPDPIADLSIYVENFAAFIKDTSVVIGITRSSEDIDYEPFYQYLEEQGLCFPVIRVDPRDKDDMVELIMTLIAMLEYS